MAKTDEIGRRATRGMAATGVAQIVKVFTTTATTIVVARTLSPSDYGVSAMVAPLMGLIMTFQNLGFTQAVVQARELDQEHSNALFWLSVLISIFAALVMAALAPLVSSFYGDVRAGYVTAATGLTILVTGLKLQHQALLNREMRFHALSINDIVVAVATFVLTALAALILKNYWAIWLGIFLNAVVSTVMMWRACPWRPRLGASFRGVRKLVVFGANLTGFNLINFFARNLDNVIVAKAEGAEAVGLYDRSYKLMLFPLQNFNQPLSRVMLPVLGRVRDDPARYRRVYELVLRALALVSMPGILAAAMCSEQLVPFLLGERWAAASPIFFWLSLTAIVQCVPSTTGWLYISTGNTRNMMYWGMFSSTISIISFFIGVRWGAVGVACAYFTGQLATLPLQYHYATRRTPVSQRFMYLVQLPSLAGGLFAWGIVAMAREALVARGLPTVLLLALAVVASYFGAVAAQACTPGGRQAMAEMLRLAGNLLPDRFRRGKGQLG
ncbi:lipopolysaccharide biosynthesis protein [Novosphingobium sp. PhB57]|uniref:lipopolysaccharide biosynthesis protein n=1 Tax=Novosphingobium sp. PhB57 TaxID=2485107 RepID=UPI00104FBA2A|nr:lipopolysaccharide biosynthesis protein [Novosphingobium sp. PhB57]